MDLRNSRTAFLECLDGKATAFAFRASDDHCTSIDYCFSAFRHLEHRKKRFFSEQPIFYDIPFSEFAKHLFTFYGYLVCGYT